MPQTIVGLGFANISNYAGQVDKVDYWGGATVTSGKNWGETAVTLGSYIVGNRTIAADPNNPLFQHEYGHYLQSQSEGWGYLFTVGIPSLLDTFSDSDHDFHPVEQDANMRAYMYFNESVPGFYKSKQDMYEKYGWDFYQNPLERRWNYIEPKYRYYPYPYGRQGLYTKRGSR